VGEEMVSITDNLNFSVSSGLDDALGASLVVPNPDDVTCPTVVVCFTVAFVDLD